MRVLLALMFFLTGCGSAGTRQREPDEYTGCATDEHWRTFDDQAPQNKVSDTMAPEFTSPHQGATVPASTKVLLAWKQDPQDPGTPDGDVPYRQGPGCDHCCPQFNLGALTTLHLPAISGNVYDLQFSVSGILVHRALTTLQEWTPPDALWASWRGKTVAVKIVRMTLFLNDLRQGPYTPGMPLSFSVGS